MKNEKTYSSFVRCSNCDFEGELEIMKGTTVGMKSCPNCGCLSLEKNEKIKRKNPFQEIDNKFFCKENNSPRLRVIPISQEDLMKVLKTQSGIFGLINKSIREMSDDED